MVGHQRFTETCTDLRNVGVLP